MTVSAEDSIRELNNIDHFKRVWIDGELARPAKSRQEDNEREDSSRGNERTISPSLSPTISPSLTPSFRPSTNPVAQVVYMQFSMWAGRPENEQTLLEEIKINSLEDTFMNYKYESFNAKRIFADGSYGFLDDLQHFLQKILCRDTDFKLVTSTTRREDFCPKLSIKRSHTYDEYLDTHPTTILSNQDKNVFFLEDKQTKLHDYHDLELKWTEFKVEFPLLHIGSIYGAMAKEEEHAEVLENSNESIVDPVIQVQQIVNTAVEHCINKGEFDNFLRNSITKSQYDFVAVSSQVGTEENVLVMKLEDTKLLNSYLNTERQLNRRPLEKKLVSLMSTIGLSLFISTTFFVFCVVTKSRKRAKKREQQDRWNVMNGCVNGPLHSDDGLDHILTLPVDIFPSICTNLSKRSSHTLPESDSDHDIEHKGSSFLPGGIKVIDDPKSSNNNF